MLKLVYRSLFMSFFIVGFIGAFASADRDDTDPTSKSFVAILKDMKEAQEIDEINNGKYDVRNDKQDGISDVQALLENVETP